MLDNIELTGTAWVAITDPGESGMVATLPISEYNGENVVLITHTTGTPDGDSPYIPLLPRIENDDVMILSADTTVDVFYARCIGPNGTATIAVDVV